MRRHESCLKHQTSTRLRHRPRRIPGSPADAALERRRTSRGAAVFKWKNDLAVSRPGADDGRGGDRRRRMAARAADDGQIRRRPAVAGDAQHSRTGPLQHRDQPLHAVHRASRSSPASFARLPGPMFWVCLYLILDFGSIFPYLAASAATPLDDVAGESSRHRIEHGDAADDDLAVIIFLLSLIPLMIFGGKIYNSLKAMMTFKMVDRPGLLAVSGDRVFASLAPGSKSSAAFSSSETCRSGEETNLDNVFVALVGRGHALLSRSTCRRWPAVGPGGHFGPRGTVEHAHQQLHPRPGWGMGSHVGAIPSLVGGHNIQLSHVGTVFHVDARVAAALEAWVQASDARPALRLDAGLLLRPGPAQHVVGASSSHTRARSDQAKWAASVMTADGSGKRSAREPAASGWESVPFHDAVLRISGAVPAWPRRSTVSSAAGSTCSGPPARDCTRSTRGKSGTSISECWWVTLSSACSCWSPSANPQHAAGYRRQHLQFRAGLQLFSRGRDQFRPAPA